MNSINVIIWILFTCKSLSIIEYKLSKGIISTTIIYIETFLFFIWLLIDNLYSL